MKLQILLCSDLVYCSFLMRIYYHFGIIVSLMHNAWMRVVCGRLKSDYRYSAGSFTTIFPGRKTNRKTKAAIEAAAQAVLDARAQFPGSTLADLYDPLTMPPVLLKAHQQLDSAVDAAYGKTTFQNRSPSAWRFYLNSTRNTPASFRRKTQTPRKD